jgi:cellulose synthase/poly-beta-1,6-N-acetylglucosamine synthase-like glycosyltransferase
MRSKVLSEMTISEKTLERRRSRVLPRTSGVTVIVPAFNEAQSIAATIESLASQSLAPAQIIVVDDCSTDGTGEIAASCGARVVRPRHNTGSKAGAQSFALDLVETPLTLVVDADTTLEHDAARHLVRALEDTDVVAACGFVLPRHVRSLWERGRYVEYLFAFSSYKPVQDHYGVPLISSGCFSMYRTEALRAHGGWSNRTMAEDMDLTWQFHRCGHKVRFVPQALCYPIEPHDFSMMCKQLKRWSHGFVQNVQLHWRGLLDVPWLRTIVMVALWDATIASVAYLALLPLLAILVSPLFLLGYVVDVPAVLVPVLWQAARRREIGKALASIPGFLVLRTVNAIFMVRAIWFEVVLRRRLAVYEKGH